MSDSRYRLVRPLAMGGMAELFLGVASGAEGFEKPVAIKRMLPQLSREPALAKMFLAEARLATHLHHQNIASVYDVGRSDEGLFLVMELVNGWDLGVLLRHAQRRGQRFPPHLVAFIGTQVLAGLIHAYRRQYQGRPVLTAHRDVSPSNILVSREGEVKVTDFGIARIEGSAIATQPGTFKGKLPYSAPEALRGQPATALSDQFSLGIVLHELLAGQHPFGRGDEDPMAFALAIAEREPPPLPDVPAPLLAVVTRSLEKHPEARFAQPEEMAEALARYLAQAGEPAHAHSLATFIQSLAPPLTLVEREDATTPPSPPGSVGTAPTVRRPSLSTRAVDPISFELQPMEDWREAPGGAALSMSGRRVTGATPPSNLNPPLAPGLSPLAEDTAAPRAPFSREATFSAESLGASESSESGAPPSAPPSPRFSPPSLPGREHEELHLAERAPKPVTPFPLTDEPSPWLRRWGRTLGKLVLLVVVVGAGVVALPFLKPRLMAVRYAVAPAQQPSTLSILSDPPDATVTVDGRTIGTTPMFIDNVYPSQDIPVQITLKGYKPWKGTFTGGQPASIDVRLTRR